MRIRSVFVRVVFWVTIFFAVFSLALTLLFESGALTPSVVEAVDSRLATTGLTFHAGSLSWRPWSGLIVGDVLITTRADTDSSRASRRVVSVKRIQAGFRVMDILRGNLRLSRLKLDAPDLDLAALLDWSARMSHQPSSGTVVRIEELQLEDARVRGSTGDLLSKLSLDGNFEAGLGTWRAEVGEAKSHVTIGRFSENVSLGGGLEMHEGLLALEDVHAKAVGGTIQLRGRLDPRGDQASQVFLHADAVPLQKVGEWLGMEHPLLFSTLQCDVAATGRPDSMHLTGQLQGRRGDDVQRTIDFSGTRVKSRLALDSFRFRSGTSIMDLTGQLDFSKGPSIEAVAVFRNFDPSTALADSNLSVVQGLNGAIRFAGTGLTRRTFRGTADVRLDRAAVFGMKLGTGNLQVAMDSGALSVERADISASGAKLRGTATIDAKDQVQAQFTADISDLAALSLPGGVLAEIAPSGRASADLALSGPLAAPAVDATVRLSDVHAAGLSAGTLDVSAKAERLSSDARWEFRANGTQVGRGERRFDRLAADGYREGSSVIVRSATLAGSGGELQLAGKLDVGEEGRLTGTVDSLELHGTNDVRWVNSGTITVERTAQGVTLQGVDLRGGGGALAGNATFGKATQVKASGRGVDLALLAPFLPGKERVAGKLDFDASGTLGADTLAADVRVDLAQGQWGDRTFDHLSGRVALRDDRADLQDVSISGPGLKAHLGGVIALPGGGLSKAFADSATRARVLEQAEFHGLDAQVEAPDFDWVWKRIPHQPARGGSGSLAVKIDGPLKAPTATLHLAVAGGSVGPETLDSLVADASFDGSALTVTRGTLRAGAGAVAISGTVPLECTVTSPIPRLRPGVPMDLHLDGQSFPLDALSPLVSLFALVSGTADAKLALQGVPGALGFVGDFKVTKAMVTIPTFAEPLVNGEATGHFDAKGLQLASARLSDGHEGVVEGSGRVSITNLHATDFNIAVTARDYHYQSSLNGIKGVGSGNMDILARTASDGRLLPFFQGSFQVSRADIGEKALLPPSADTGGVELPLGVVAPPEERPDTTAGRAAGPTAPAMVLAEIRLRGDRNIWLETPEVDCELAGDVTFHATETAMGITGSARSLHGTYTAVTTRFDVTRAEVDFVDAADPGASIIDAEATTTVMEEDVTATVNGTVLAPVVHLNTRSGMSEPEIYEMLALRVKRTDTAAEGTTATAAQEQGVFGKSFQDSFLSRIATQLGGDIGREIGIDTFAYDRGEGGLRPSVTVGKTVGRDVLVKYHQAVGTNQDPAAPPDQTVARESLETPERSLTVEYRLNQRFSLQGETGTLPQGDDYLNVDLRTEWGY